MNPKSGKAGSAVSPAAPDEAIEADEADPGEIAKVKEQQTESGTGKYGSTPEKPHQQDAGGAGAGGENDDAKTSWIEIELIDGQDEPVAGEPYKITLPDGTVASGTLDQKGFARVSGFEPGSCKVSFPKLDQDAWEKA